MRCDDIQERLMEALYDEAGGAQENADLLAHLRTCTACREQLDKLKQTRDYLQLWKDEPPLRSTAIGRRRLSAPRDWNWRFVRRAAIAAMAVICLLALANMQVSWNKDGFYFRTSLFSAHNKERDYYTKNEIRELLKRALDDSESRVNETNYLMMQRALDTIEQDRWMDLRLIRSSAAQKRNSN